MSEYAVAELKKALFDNIIAQLNSKAEEAKEAIQMAKESRDNETKSSAGDKYETARSMMDIEIAKNEAQLSKTLKTKKDLQQINLSKRLEKAGFGSLVVTNKGVYFIAAAFGKIVIDTQVVYAISLVSPIGQLLEDKTCGDTFQLNGQHFEILEIA